MSPKLQPWEWARAMSAYVDDTHARKVRECESIEHLRKAVRYEAERQRGARPERVGRLNKRIQTLSE